MPISDLNIEGLQALTDDTPVTMLNLMRLREQSADGNGSGWDAYQRYSMACAPMIKARGGTVLWAGAAQAVALGGHAAGHWDFVALVRYPSRAAFLDMMTSTEYEAIANPHRVNGLAAHVIIATTSTYSKFEEAHRAR